MKIVVHGFFGKFNIGDESYKKTFQELFPGNEFVFSDSPVNDEFDVCILGGGNILSDNYVRMALDAKAKRKVVFSASAQAHTPFSLLSQFDAIIVRDKASEAILKEHGVKCHLGADAAFSLTPNPQAGRSWLERQFASERLDLYSKVVGVVLNGHLGQAKGEQLARDFITLSKAAQDIATVADNTSASFVFFPMSTGSPHDDRATNGLAASRCKFWKKNLIVYDRLTVQETLDLISTCDAVISTRLHSSIFSVVAHKPFVDLVHHDKNRSFLETCGLEECGISYWSFGSQELKAILNKTLSSQIDLAKIHHSQEQLLKESLPHVCFGQPTELHSSDISG